MAATGQRRERTAEGLRERRDTTVNIRMPAATRSLIDEAASAAGKSRTEFIVESARRQAIDTLLDQRLFLLEPDRYDAFMAMLDKPPLPSAALRALMKRRPTWSA